MKRGGPIKRRTPMKAKAPFKVRVKEFVNKVVAPWKRKADSVRKTARKLSQYGPPGFVEFVHQGGCVVARASGTAGGCLGPIEAAHVVSRGAGGTWRDVCGLCALHHREQHSIGILTFQERYEIDLEIWAAATVHQFQKEQDGW